MPKIPVVSGKRTVRAFEKIGFTVVRQSGSHVVLKNEHNSIVTIPLHKELKKGTLRKGILKPLRISVEEFIETIKK